MKINYWKIAQWGLWAAVAIVVVAILYRVRVFFPFFEWVLPDYAIVVGSILLVTAIVGSILAIYILAIELVEYFRNRAIEKQELAELSKQFQAELAPTEEVVVTKKSTTKRARKPKKFRPPAI